MSLFNIPAFLSREECDIIFHRILDTEELVKSKGKDIHTGTSDDSLTGRFWCNNYLYDDVIAPILIPKLKVIFVGRVWIQCWANTFRRGEGIAAHSHRPPIPKYQKPLPWSCVNLFIGGDPGIGTWFVNKNYPNNPGDLMVFESETLHWVSPNPTNDVRISMAMDVYPYKPEDWSNPEHYYYLK